MNNEFTGNYWSKIIKARVLKNYRALNVFKFLKKLAINLKQLIIEILNIIQQMIKRRIKNIYRVSHLKHIKFGWPPTYAQHVYSATILSYNSVDTMFVKLVFLIYIITDLLYWNVSQGTLYMKSANINNPNKEKFLLKILASNTQFKIKRKILR